MTLLRKEHVSNEDGNDLEKTIASYRKDSWHVVKVQWEFSDEESLKEDGPGCRWVAFFVKREADSVSDKSKYFKPTDEQLAAREVRLLKTTEDIIKNLGNIAKK